MVVTPKIAIAGTDSRVRSSSSRSLRRIAPTARSIRRTARRRRRRATSRAGAQIAGRPPRSPSARSAPARPPAGSWLVTTRVRPDARPTSGSSRAVAAGSRLASGSSRSRSSGSCSTARAAATRWTMPRDRTATGSSARAVMPTASSTSSMRVGRDVVQARVEAQVLPRREVAVEHRLVREEPDPPAHRPALARQLAAEDARRARVRAQQAGEDAQERRLARRRWDRGPRAWRRPAGSA